MDRVGIISKNLIKEYAELKYKYEYEEKESIHNEKVRDAIIEQIEEKTFKLICDDICKLKTDEIVKEREKKLKEIEVQKKRSQLKFILIEGVILGMITGILVNQITDIITYTKGDNNYQATSWIIFILFLVGIIFAFVVYLNKIEEYFIKRKEDKDGGSV